MPQVPRIVQRRVLDEPTNIRNSNVQSPNVQLRTQGVEQMGQAAENLVQTVSKIEQEERQKANQIQVMDAEDKLTQWELDYLYNRENGALTVKGKDAFGLPDKFDQDYETKRSEILQSLGNDEARSMFNKSASQKYKAISRQLYRHMAKEGMEYDDNLTQSRIETEYASALQKFQDPDSVADAVSRTRATIAQYAERNGLPAKMAKTKMLEAESKIHSGIVSKLLDGGADVEAKSYFEKHEKQFSEEDRSRVLNLVNEGALRGESQRQADSIMSQGLGYKEALALTEKIKDPELRDETRRRVKQRLADKRAADKMQQDELYNEAYNLVEANPTIDAIPPSKWAALRPAQKQNIRSAIAQLRKGIPIETDLKTYYDLEQLAGDPRTRDAFLRTNLLEKRHLLSESDFKKMSGLQRGLRENDGSASKTLDGIETKNSIVKTALQQVGIETGSRASNEDATKATFFKREVDKRVIDLQEEKGRKLNNMEVRQIVDDLTVEVVTDEGIFWNTTMPAFEAIMRGEQDVSVRYESIPVGERVSIEEALRSFGMEVNQQNVLRLYMKRRTQASNVN